jgi:hypothetical protein
MCPYPSILQQFGLFLRGLLHRWVAYCAEVVASPRQHAGLQSLSASLSYAFEWENFTEPEEGVPARMANLSKMTIYIYIDDYLSLV